MEYVMFFPEYASMDIIVQEFEKKDILVTDILPSVNAIIVNLSNEQTILAEQGHAIITLPSHAVFNYSNFYFSSSSGSLIS